LAPSGTGNAVGYLCPRLDAENAKVSAVLASSANPYFSPSTSCLLLMASLLSPKRPSDELLEPFRKQAPQPPQQADKNSEDKETVLELRSLQECRKPDKSQVDKHDSEDDLCEKLESKTTRRPPVAFRPVPGRMPSWSSTVPRSRNRENKCCCWLQSGSRKNLLSMPATGVCVQNVHFHISVVRESLARVRSAAIVRICNTILRATPALVTTKTFWPSGFSQAT